MGINKIKDNHSHKWLVYLRRLADTQIHNQQLGDSVR